MSYRVKSVQWRTKLKGICPCFMETISHEPCLTPCNLRELKELLLQKDTPDRKTIIKTMIKAGVFNKREIAFAVMEIHKAIYLSSERRVEETIQDLKAEGYKVFTDDLSILKAWK